MKIDNKTLGIVVAMFMVLIFAVVGLEYAGRETDSVIYLAVAVLVPTVVSILGIKATGDLQKDVKQVKKQTNGTLSKLLDRLEALGEDVSAEREHIERLNRGEDSDLPTQDQQ